MTHEDFLKMHVLTEVAFKLNQEAERYSKSVDWTVRCAVGRLHPELVGVTLHDSHYHLMWDGVIFGYKREKNVWGFGAGEEDNEADKWESHTIRMTYKEVFGWDHDHTKAIDEKWAYEYLHRVMDGFKKQPEYPNYDI